MVMSVVIEERWFSGSEACSCLCMAVIVEEEEVDRQSWYLVMIFQPYWLVLVKVVDGKEVQKVVMGADEPNYEAENPSFVYFF